MSDEPDAAASAVSRRLAERIRASIDAAGGWIGFDRYMHAVLYAPGLGYYSAGAEKLGAGGDFTTAPELSPFLARAIAATYAPMLGTCARPAVLELGAGTGRLARQLVDALAGHGLVDVEYRILEPSASLRARQQAELRACGDRVRWLERLPEAPIDGLVVANEVADALPVARFEVRDGQALPLGVGLDGSRFVWRAGAPDAALARAVAALEAQLGRRLPDGYVSEIGFEAAAWTRTLAGALGAGALLIVDYGMVRHEYYHPQRCDGTLICHYRHRAHADPFAYPGLQDVSAWVDFSALADAGRAAGARVAGFTTQAQFVVKSLERLGADALAGLTPAELAALKTLVLPGEMGERFKLLAFANGDAAPDLPGRDMRPRL